MVLKFCISMMFQKYSIEELAMYVEKEHIISWKQKAAEKSNFAKCGRLHAEGRNTELFPA